MRAAQSWSVFTIIIVDHVSFIIIFIKIYITSLVRVLVTAAPRTSTCTLLPKPNCRPQILKHLCVEVGLRISQDDYPSYEPKVTMVVRAASLGHTLHMCLIQLSTGSGWRMNCNKPH